MIEHSIVNGKPAMVAYLKNGFEPATKDDATLVKVMWDDGSMMFLVPGEQPVQKVWEEAQHPRASDGRFGEGGSPAQRSAVREVDLQSDIAAAFGHNTAEFGSTDPEERSDALAMWRETFGDVSPGEVKRSMLGPLEPDFTNVEIGEGEFSEEGVKLHFAGEGWEMVRVVIPSSEDGEGYAVHDKFVLSKDMQGKGIAKAVLASQMELYERIGVAKVRLNANINIGGYAWAKYGFVPTGDGSGEEGPVADGLYELKGQLGDKGLSITSPRDVWKIADSPNGKDALINSDWQGVLDLNDKEAMIRFNSYIRKVK